MENQACQLGKLRQYVRVFLNPKSLVLGGVLIAAGCGSPSSVRTDGITPLEAPLKPSLIRNEKPRELRAREAVHRPAEVRAEPVSNLEVNSSEWVSLAGWLPHRRAENGRPEWLDFSLSSPKVGVLTDLGPLVVKHGTRRASVDGVEFWLGFAPVKRNGEIFLHPIDLAANLEPFLSTEMRMTDTRGVVVVDPGHGGDNPGTRSLLYQRVEKDFTLDWARRLKPLLEEQGWKVLLTRTTDSTVELSDRVAFANQHQAQWFISLHFNSGLPNEQAHGIETYCLTPSGLPSTLVRGYEDDPQSVYPNNAFDRSNIRFAMVVHSALLKRTGAADRGIRRARFMNVLQGQKQPAILVEGGYLSNPQEAAKILTAGYRQLLAEGVAEAFARL